MHNRRCLLACPYRTGKKGRNARSTRLPQAVALPAGVWYDPELMKLYVVGGGCLIKNFREFDTGRVIINEDVCTTAKGYEYPAHLRARKGGMV